MYNHLCKLQTVADCSDICRQARVVITRELEELIWHKERRRGDGREEGGQRVDKRAIVCVH